MRTLLVAHALLAGLALMQAPPAVAQTADQTRRIAQGETVTWIEDSGQPIKTCVAIGLVPVPVDKVYRAMTDYAHYPKVFRILTSCTIVKQQGNDLICRFIMQPPWPLPERWVVTRNQLDPIKRTVAFRMLEGNLNVYDGYLHAEAWGQGKTKVTYRTRVDPGIPLLPAWAITWGTRTSLPGIVRDLGAYAKTL